MGFVIADRLAARLGARGPWRRHGGDWALARLAGGELGILRPHTFMNRSGEAVRSLVRARRLRPADLLICYDDLDLPVGRLRLRPSGGHGGHRGLESVLSALGTDAVPRLRLGIGRPPEGVDPAGYVLSPFDDAERPLVEPALERAVEAVIHWAVHGIEPAMARFNAPGDGDPSSG